MSTETAKMVACAIVSSMIDSCNSVLVGMSKANVNKLEDVQYALARMVTGIAAYSRDHVTQVFAKLHWLSIRARISFKISMMEFKIRLTEHPSFLTKLIEDAVPSRTLRSSTCRQGTLRE